MITAESLPFSQVRNGRLAVVERVVVDTFAAVTATRRIVVIGNRTPGVGPASTAGRKFSLTGLNVIELDYRD